MTPAILIPEPENRIILKDAITSYNKIRYHCPKCSGTALRVTPEESRTLQEFSQAEKQVRKLITTRRKEAEHYKNRLDTPESEQ